MIQIHLLKRRKKKEVKEPQLGGPWKVPMLNGP